MRQVRRGAADRGRPQHTKPVSKLSWQEDGGRAVPDCDALPPARVMRRTGLAVVLRAGSFSGRRGTGRWPIGQVMALFPAGVRSPAMMAVMGGGRLVKREGAAGEFATEPSAPGVRLVEQHPSGQGE